MNSAQQRESHHSNNSFDDSNEKSYEKYGRSNLPELSVVIVEQRFYGGG